MTLPALFSLYCSDDHRALHSFPTRRSSDLRASALLFAAEGATVVAADIDPSLEGVTHRVDVADEEETEGLAEAVGVSRATLDRKSTRLNSSHMSISYAVFCLKKKKNRVSSN